MLILSTLLNHSRGKFIGTFGSKRSKDFNHLTYAFTKKCQNLKQSSKSGIVKYSGLIWEREDLMDNPVINRTRFNTYGP